MFGSRGGASPYKTLLSSPLPPPGSYQRCVAEGNILVKGYNTVCREKLNFLKKEEEFAHYNSVSLRLLGRLNIVASVSYWTTIHSTPQLSDVLIRSFSPICLFLFENIDSTSLTLGKTANQKQTIHWNLQCFPPKAISEIDHCQANTETWCRG